MASFILSAAMKGRFTSDAGNVYDNFQMLGYITAGSHTEAVTGFFDQPPYPVQWSDVEYLWAERLFEGGENARYGDYQRIYIDTLLRRSEAV